MNNENEHKLRDEKDLQYFIANYPWLLNLDYERVIELKDGGIEFQIGDQMRIDLILKDRRSGSPVIVEFKFRPFYRENIGQILEYKARVATSFNKENYAIVYSIFGENILTPKLALVVEICDDFTRVACNMAGIDVYEYRNFSEEIKVPGKIETIKNFAESLKGEPMPLSLGREDKLEEEVYRPIRRVLDEKNLMSYVWQEPRRSNAYFFPQMANLFLNRWLFADEKISMGLFEDVFGDAHDVIIAYFSKDKNLLERFQQFYERNYNYTRKIKWYDQYTEGWLERNFPRKEFFDGVEVKFKEELNRYLHTIKLTLPETHIGDASK